MFDVANKITGIYKTFDCSKSISIVPKKIESMMRKRNGENNDFDENEEEKC